jgi:hypothetical protein
MAVYAKRRRLSGFKSILNVFKFKGRILFSEVSMILVLELDDTDFEKCD